jgi:hypothetical protein
MYDLLEDAEREGFDDIVSWVPSGRAFQFHNRLSFEKLVMPRYFPKMNVYKSFRRQLNTYGIYKDKSPCNCPENGTCNMAALDILFVPDKKAFVLAVN